MKKEIDWVIHYVANGVKCSVCGEEENGFPQYICDAHTHGMDRYKHPEFQVVLNYGMDEVGRLLNTMGCRVRDGERFRDGDLVKGLYEDCDILLREMPDCNGKALLRLIIPDKQNRWPEQAEEPYTYQMIATPALCIGSNNRSVQDN